MASFGPIAHERSNALKEEDHVWSPLGLQTAAKNIISMLTSGRQTVLRIITERAEVSGTPTLKEHMRIPGEVVASTGLLGQSGRPPRPSRNLCLKMLNRIQGSMCPGRCVQGNSHHRPTGRREHLAGLLIGGWPEFGSWDHPPSSVASTLRGGSHRLLLPRRTHTYVYIHIYMYMYKHTYVCFCTYVRILIGQWWYMLLILILRRAESGGSLDQDHPCLQSEF